MTATAALAEAISARHRDEGGHHYMDPPMKPGESWSGTVRSVRCREGLHRKEAEDLLLFLAAEGWTLTRKEPETGGR